MAVATPVTLVKESVHVRRDLNCVAATGASPFDNYAKLAPVFLYTGRTNLQVVFDGRVYGLGQTLVGTHRDGFSVVSESGRGGAWAEANWAHSGATPGEFEFGGPSAGLAWIGDPGGTMVELWSPRDRPVR